MKTLFLSVLFLITLCKSYSQYGGIYLTAGDYKNDKLTLKTGKESIRINADLPFRHSYVKVRQKGKTTCFRKDSIWGMKDGRGLYRSFNSEMYTLIENEGIMLYKRRIHGRHMRIYYYFSKTHESPVLDLNIENLEKSFAGNRRFLDLIKSSIKEEKDLSAYEEKSKSLKITAIYKLSTKN